MHDTELAVEDLIAEREKVVSRVVLCGIHKGDFPDLPATYRPFTLSLTPIFHLVDAKSVEECEVYNELALMTRLGMELVPKGSQDQDPEFIRPTG